MLYEKNADKLDYFLIDDRISNDNLSPFSTRAHYHDSIEIFALKSGSVELTVNGVDYTLKKGEIAFLNPCDIHSYYSNDCQGFALLFSKKYYRSFTESDYSILNIISLNDNDFNELIDKIIEFKSLKRQNKLNEFLVESFALNILGKLVYTNNFTKKVKDKNRDLMLQVIDYIDDNYASELSLISVSNAFGYTPNYFSSLFNKFTAMSFSDYLNFVRYNKAKKMLNDNNLNLTVTDIAIACGFGSMNTFYRAKQKFEKS